MATDIFGNTVSDNPDFSQFQPKTQAPAKKQINYGSGLGGFIKRNLPTIGGVIGGVATLPLEALDAVSGVGGTALNVAGAAGGQALGQKLQNSLTGNNASTAKAGVTGGVGELGGRFVGGILGKTIGKAGNAASNSVTKKAAQATENEAQTKAAQIDSQFANVPAKVRNATDVQATTKHLNSLGIEPTVENMHKASNIITGEHGVASGTVRQILGGVPKVPLDNVMGDVNKALLGETGRLGDHSVKGTVGNNVLKSIRNTLQTSGFGNEGSLTNKADANDILDTIQKAEDRVRELGTTGTDGGEKKVFQALSKSLKQALKDGGVDSAVSRHVLNAEDQGAVHAAVGNAGLPTEFANHIVNGINNAKSLKDLRGIQAPFVNASKLAEAADVANGGALNKAPKLAGETSAAGDALRLGANLATGSHMGVAQSASKLAKASGALDKVTGKIANVNNTASAVNNKVPGSLSRILETVGGQSVAGGVNSQPQQDSTPAPDLTTPTPTLPDATNQLSQAPQDTGSYSAEQLINDINNSPKQADTFISLYKTLNPTGTAANTVKPSSQQVGSAQSGLQSLQQLQSMLQANPDIVNKTAIPGGSLPGIGGLINNVTGTGQYKAAANNTLDAIARIRTGAAMSKNEEAFYHSLLPQPGDDEQTRAYKIQQLQQALSPYASSQIAG